MKYMLLRDLASSSLASCTSRHDAWSQKTHALFTTVLQTQQHSIVFAGSDFMIIFMMEAVAESAACHNRHGNSSTQKRAEIQYVWSLFSVLPCTLLRQHIKQYIQMLE